MNPHEERFIYDHTWPGFRMLDGLLDDLFVSEVLLMGPAYFVKRDI